MIRERRAEDLDRLCEVVAAAGLGVPDAASARRWLLEVDAERSWVFDQAPVSVAPTRNVVGHVQHYRPASPVARELSAATGTPADDLVAVGRLVVGRVAHAHGIARYLMRESVSSIRARGSTPVLDLRACDHHGEDLAARLGFQAVADGTARGWAVRTRPGGVPPVGDDRR